MSSFRRWSFWRKWLGQKAERHAAEFLKQAGYKILAINIHDRYGEIDLIAVYQEMIVIVEVRSSESKSFEELAETVDRKKQKKIIDATTRFLHKRRLLGKVNIRFDVLVIRFEKKGEYKIHHYEDAFRPKADGQMY